MISTHILDTSRGHPAAGVPVRLEVREGDTWRAVAAGTTNVDGRHAFEVAREPGVYQLWFDIEDYYAGGAEHFFMNTPVVFRITDTTRKYHVPLLVNPYGYSTYRGS
jgi:5-hydroxyisourate hydrolase